MDQVTITAASGMRARLESLELLANNISNVSTAGYKADREFYSLFQAADAVGAQSETGSGAAVLPVIESNWIDFSQSTLTATGNPLDLALDGQGLFGVQGPGGTLYTRGGPFRLSRQGILETREGYPVRTVEGPPIRVPNTSQPVEIGADGIVRQEGQALGTIEVINTPPAGQIAKQGGNYFRLVTPNPAPGRASQSMVQQGKIEASNVGAAEAAVRLVSVMRQFEMLQRAISLGGEMNRRAVEEVARVG